MIREFNVEDKEQLVKIVKQGIVVEEQDIINHVTSRDTKIIVYDNKSDILGFSSLEIGNKTDGQGFVRTYVVPSSREKGIGALLYNEIMKYVDELNLKCIITRFRVDKDDATSFYKKLGYEKWYGIIDLYYNGSEQPKSNLRFISYEDKYFEQYAEGLRNSFYEMRKVHDFQPHLCCDLNKEKREELLSCKDNIFLLLDNNDLIASAKVTDNGFLDDIFVVPSYQGKGYGRIITQFAINKAIKKSTISVETSVVEWNTRALNLYLSLGFDIVQTTHYYQLFI